jgi:hypothetical protein
MHGVPASCVPRVVSLEDSTCQKSIDPNYTKFANIFGAFKTICILSYSLYTLIPNSPCNSGFYVRWGIEGSYLLANMPSQYPGTHKTRTARWVD